MKVLFDHQTYVRQNYGGISRYFYELTKGLSQSDIEVCNSVRYSSNVYTTDKVYYNAKPLLPSVKFRGKIRLSYLLNQLSTIQLLKDKSTKVFHPTYYDTYFLNHLKGLPFIITFYDLIHEKFGEEFKELKDERTLLYKRKILLDRAAKIIAISESTKSDIINMYNIEPKRIEVVYLANSLESASAYDIDSTIENNYVLFVGNRRLYKNFDLFVEAIQPLLIKEKSLKVICAGGGSFTKSEQHFLSNLKINNQVLQIPINDRKLSALYSKALFFIFPSMYEGFGIPVLEAFKNSCPVILSNTSSLPEVGGDAAVYIDPKNKEDILDKVESLVYNSQLRKNLIVKGKQQIQKFSWDKTVFHHENIYNSVI